VTVGFFLGRAALEAFCAFKSEFFYPDSISDSLILTLKLEDVDAVAIYCFCFWTRKLWAVRAIAKAPVTPLM